MLFSKCYYLHPEVSVFTFFLYITFQHRSPYYYQRCFHIILLESYNSICFKIEPKHLLFQIFVQGKRLACESVKPSKTQQMEVWIYFRLWSCGKRKKSKKKRIKWPSRNKSIGPASQRSGRSFTYPSLSRSLTLLTDICLALVQCSLSRKPL